MDREPPTSYLKKSAEQISKRYVKLEHPRFDIWLSIGFTKLISYFFAGNSKVLSECDVYLDAVAHFLFHQEFQFCGQSAI